MLVCNFEFSSLELVCDLVFVICDFGFEKSSFARRNTPNIVSVPKKALTPRSAHGVLPGAGCERFLGV
ncbi:MAG: hypothetical protein UY61_C0077G0002 [Candidatus Adlerbacteria bacterium GW2011_GWC1_50_9]|uniref:Uncharacterized protein n=1 Tax=Candidatus Adlerbacteria bacterium GW2011_GWC1_50_9 TaxID=1618608 RepID=A0A0G1ZHA5_9BACT|nr:MAG: hypothetical protein UY61_C0077G0002 [Candidatus Adlerbacteria bacterium GW2011_GWC1_50_9]